MFCENMNLNKRFHFQDSKVEPGQNPTKAMLPMFYGIFLKIIIEKRNCIYNLIL